MAGVDNLPTFLSRVDKPSSKIRPFKENMTDGSRARGSKKKVAFLNRETGRRT